MFMKQWILLAAMALTLSSCGTKADEHSVEQKQTGDVVALHVQGHAKSVQTKHWMQDGGIWIPAEKAAELYDYHYSAKPKSGMIAMGYSDPIYRFAVGSKNARFGDQSILLSQAPRMIDNTVCLELRSLSQLLQTPVKWDAGSQSVVIEERKDEAPIQISRDMAAGGNTVRAQALGSDDEKKAEVFSIAKRFIGTPYEFNAEPYETSRKFDCSSFMQYIFGRVGIDLPRSSIAQSTVGQYVSKDNLKAGDVLFFYTPGRYETNNIVGHVGLYMGNDQIIQTYGDPGVTISQLSGYWEGRLMWARRLL